MMRGPQQPGLTVLELVLGRVAHQAAGITHAVHHAVAGVDAGGAGDALVLQALADVDAGRADLYAERAVGAVAEARGTRIAALLAPAARLAALRVVGDDQGVVVEHRALEARVRAHVLADLLAQEAGVAIGRQAVEQHPERFPGPEAEVHDLGAERADRREEADEGEAGPGCEADPQELLRGLLGELLRAPRRLVELHALRAVALGNPLHPQEGLGPDGLRAGVAAPDPAGDGREEEQAERRDHQQPGEEDEVLRPERQAEDVELARRQVEQDRLASAPARPGREIEEAEQHPDREVAPGREAALGLARIDLAMGLVVRVGLGRCTSRWQLDATHQGAGSGGSVHFSSSSVSRPRRAAAQVAAPRASSA